MKAPLRYATAVAVPVVAVLTRLLQPGFFQAVPSLPFFVAVVVVSVISGPGPAFVATLIGAALTAWLFPLTTPQLVLVITTGFGLSWLITARYAAERTHVEEQFSQLTAIANVAPAVAFITNAQSEVTYVNDRWLEFSGRTRAEELGSGWLSEIHPDDVPSLMSVFQKAFEARDPVELEYRQRRHDGTYRRMLSRADPRFQKDGTFDGYIGIAIDVHDLRHAQQEQERLARDISHERGRLASIMSNVPGVVWEAWGDPDKETQRIDFVSDHVLRMLGYTVEEWLSTPNFWLTIVHPDDAEQAARRAHDHYLALGATTNTFRWMTRDGRALWVESHSTVIEDEHGAPVGMRGVTLDITPRKRAEDSLRFLGMASDVLSSSLDYESTLKATSQLAVPALADWCVVAMVEPSGEARRVAVSHANPAKDLLAQRLLTIPRRTDLPPTVQSTFETLKPFVLDIDDATLSQLTYDKEHADLVRELGIASLLVVPVAARERILGTITLVSATRGRYEEHDIELAMLLSRRVAIAIDNAQLYRAAREASNAKDEFLATISHELRTPMTATLGWVRLLSLGMDDETTKTAIQAIDHSTRAQATLIDDILDVSSIILGKFRMTRGAVDLRAVVDEAVTALRPAIEAKVMSISIDNQRWSGTVQGDPSRLQQIVWNLISNAAKFGRRSGVIHVTVEREGDTARVIVRDDGAGIAPSLLPHVFDRFRQGDSGSTRNHGGLGLGLAIVRHLAELHGGTVHAMSDGPETGATFIVELPAMVEEPDASNG